jgi:hypothetical protein
MMAMTSGLGRLALSSGLSKPGLAFRRVTGRALKRQSFRHNLVVLRR